MGLLSPFVFLLVIFFLFFFFTKGQHVGILVQMLHDQNVGAVVLMRNFVRCLDS